ncbi:MAG: LytTR family DNA-binding domain-containing protein [Cyclobacteriaceae bacterium]
MTVVIIEDEEPSQQKLIDYLHQYDQNIEILAVLSSIQVCEEWFRLHKHPDLVISDIELSDGLVFDFFDQVKVMSPIIFTTHFESFIKRAFEEFSVSFITKPYAYEDLVRALQKYDSMRQAYLISFSDLKSHADTRSSYRKRFISKVSGQYLFVNSEDILYFKSQFRGVYLFAKNGKKHLVDKSLSQVESDLDPTLFFKANRNYIVSVESIVKVINLPDGSAILLISDKEIEVKITRTRVREFRQWLDK